MANQGDMPTGIEPMSPAFQADVLTTAPQHPSDNSTKFYSLILPWTVTQEVLKRGFEVTSIELSQHNTFVCVG